MTEKLQQVRLPVGISPPVLGPISSTMGEIMLISLTSQKTSLMELRSIANRVVRPRLLGVSGVSQVTIIGGELAQVVEIAFNGEVVSQVLEEQRTDDVLVRFNDASRESIEAIGRTLIDTPTGAKVPIAQVAEVRADQGPNTINRENVQRRIIIQANVARRDQSEIKHAFNEDHSCSIRTDLLIVDLP